MIRNGIVNTNREYSLGNLGEKRGATKKYSKESSLYALRHVHEQRNIFAKMDTSMYIYIYICIFQDLSIRYRNLDPSPSPLSVHDLSFRPAFAAGSFYAITLPTLVGKMGKGWKKEGGISRRKPGLKVARRLFARRES